MTTNASFKIDTVLEPLLVETSDEKANSIVLRLISIHAEPVIKGVIRYKLRLSSSRASEQAEADDIYQEAILHLLAQLRRFRQLPGKHPITDLRGMAAVIAHRTCSRWMRSRFPERHALKNRLHYLLTRQSGLALWKDRDGKLLAGFAAWKQKNAFTSRGDLSQIEGLVPQLQNLRTSKPQDLAAALATVFNHLGRPVQFDELVSTLAKLIGISDQPIESTAEGEAEVEVLSVAGDPDPAWKIEKRFFLQRLWHELQQLPLNQRTALLLNLKDSAGRGCITLFPATGIASMRQLSEAVGMKADEFAQLWNELPLEDTRIAELLGLTRQQVINARKAGRERLTRRLKGFF